MKPGEIIVKDDCVLKGLFERRFSPLLITILLDVAKEHGLVITESYRPKKHRNDLHGTSPVRAIDIREWCYSPIKAKEIEREINYRWEYDYKRTEKKVAWIHDSGKGIHFHIQVHPNTRRRAV